MIHPDKFNLTIKAAKALCFGKGSLTVGKKCQHLLGHCIMVKIGLALRKNDEKKCIDAENFKKLLTSEWKFRISSVANKRKRIQDMNKIVELPDVEDLVELRNYLVENVQKLTKVLKIHPSRTIWTELAKIVLLRLILFNKRRVSEVTDLQVEIYCKRPKWTNSREFDMSMSKIESGFSCAYLLKAVSLFHHLFILKCAFFF